jgi:hypothetical protein
MSYKPFAKQLKNLQPSLPTTDNTLEAKDDAGEVVGLEKMDAY